MEICSGTQSILNRWKNYFNNVLNINDREEDSFNENTIHTAEPFIVESDELDIKFIIEELKSHKAPGIDGIPAELFKSGGPSLCAAVHKLILAIWRQEKLPREWRNRLSYLSTKRGTKQIVVILWGFHFYLRGTKFCQRSFLRD